MAKSKTYTQEQLATAKQTLAELPDLSRDKISTPDLLAALKEQIVALSEKKGYSIAEIKSALNSVSVDASTKAISEILASSKKPRTPRRPAPKATTSIPT